MAMATISLQLFLLVAVAATAAVATSRSPLAPAPAPASSSSSAIIAPAPSPSSSATSFLRASCAVTDTPDACYKILVPYVDTFHGNLARVARAAGAFAVARQHDFGGELARLKLRGTGAGKVADMALADCSDDVSVSDAAANETLSHIDNLVAGLGSKKDLDSQKFWAQEYFSSAGSGLMQCIDWFDSVGEGAVSSPVGKEVIAGCTTVAGYMDMALQLVNAIKV